MLNQMFRGIFDTDMTNVIAVQDFLLCVGCSLVIGLILAVVFLGIFLHATKKQQQAA